MIRLSKIGMSSEKLYKMLIYVTQYTCQNMFISTEVLTFQQAADKDMSFSGCQTRDALG